MLEKCELKSQTKNDPHAAHVKSLVVLEAPVDSVSRVDAVAGGHNTMLFVAEGYGGTVRE